MNKVNKSPEPIIEVTLDTEFDLVIAHKKAMKLAEICGMNFTDQTKFATAVSEICRNALIFAKKGIVNLFVSKDDKGYLVEALVKDEGPGIKNLKPLLEKLNQTEITENSGIFNCKRLSHKLAIESSENQGTCVRIGRRIPENHPPINHMILAGWKTYFKELPPISPYDEIKRQNQLLLETLEELKAQKKQTTDQLEEIQVLNNELELNYDKLKQLSDDYELQNKLLEKRNVELDEFAYVVSHDLKAPIKNMYGLLGLIESGKLNDHKQISSIFNNQLQKIEGLINSILTYSRAGHSHVDKKEVDLNVVVDELAKTIETPKNLQIEIVGKLPVLFAEEIFLYQIYSNLLTNAVKYNDQEEGKIKVGHHENEKGKKVFFVEDNGRGIPAKKRDKVFQMFYMMQNNSGPESTGIGLAIVKKIINEKGGEIWIENPQFSDTGIRFCFTWPEQV